MANNRMLLRCPCGIAHVLARIPAGGWDWDVRSAESLEEFFEEHNDCKGQVEAPGYGPTAYRFEYESD